MKEISELNLPEGVGFTKDHEWARSEGAKVVCGISDYAQDQLGDIVFVELPRVGDSFEREEEFGVVESVKAVAELYMPLGGEILAINSALEEAPQLANKSPYSDGWMIEIKPADPRELDSLMSSDAYREMLQGGE